MPPKASAPKVSVLVMTYNHAEFISQALDSVLMQEADFDYEVLISEDCSTDGTRELVVGYQQRYPKQIRLLLSPQNIRNNSVVTRGIQAAQGDYIALLDGDDYWTSPVKLQKQVDFLERHPECTLCFHNATVIDEEDASPPWHWTPAGHPAISTLADLWLGNFIATCATVFRRGVIGEIPDWYIDLFPITDWPLHLLNAAHGKIGYINEVMGVYRYHSRGFYSPLSQARKLETTLHLYHVLNKNFGYRYDRLAKIGIAKYFVEWAEEYLARGEVAAARGCFRTALSGRPINPHVSLRRLLALGLRLYLPQLAIRRQRLTPSV